MAARKPDTPVLSHAATDLRVSGPDQDASWLFPITRSNQLLPNWIQFGGQIRNRMESQDGLNYAPVNDGPRNRSVPRRFDFKASTMKPPKVTRSGEVKIIDSKIFPVTPISAAIVTLKPGGLRELHWHPNADEWQYYISGKGRMTVFAAGSTARTMDFEEGDVGYIPISNPHYVENTGVTDPVFLEMFRNSEYQDISLAADGAHAAPAGGSAFGSGNVDARLHPQAGDGYYSGVKPGRTIPGSR